MRPQRYNAWKIPLDFVSVQLEKRISTLLGRQIRMCTRTEDDWYWSSAAIDDCFTIVEIMELITAVNGDKEMIQCSVPTESNTSRSLDMTLCRALLKQALQIDWKTEFVMEDTLWIILPADQEVSL